MNRTNRLKLIEEVQKKRNSILLCYVTGDRIGLSAQIAEDVVRPMYNHLLKLPTSGKKLSRIDLFLYSRGGDVSTPWRITSMLREFCDELTVLVPYKAQSAATMIALGADKIIMGRKGELGPIDPTLSRAEGRESAVPPSQISVEDVSSYVSFIRERAGITDQAALAEVVSLLANNLTPLTLGSVNRQYSHIRLVAKKLLSSHRSKIEEERQAIIIEALTEKMYSHGHAIGRNEAKELGLPVSVPEPFELEDILWNLYKEYESLLNLLEPLDPEDELNKSGKDELTLEKLPIACVESQKALSVFNHGIVINRARQMPQNLQINLNVSFPPTLDPAQLSQQAQQLLQDMIQQVLQKAQIIMQEEMKRQSPVIGIQIRNRIGRWEELADDSV